MKKSNKLILVSHCILNQNNGINQEQMNKGPAALIQRLINEGVGIIQLPCPSFRFQGINRKAGMQKNSNTEEYREMCEKMFQPILEDILLSLELGYEFSGIIGMNEGPSCGIIGNNGIFMEVIFNMLKEHDIDLNYVEVPSKFDNEEEFNEIDEDIRNLVLASG